MDGIRMLNGNQNNFFTLLIGIGIQMSCITINVFILFCNQNILLQVIKIT